MTSPRGTSPATVVRDKRVDLASATGAGVLGVGVGALFGASLRPAAVPLLVVGAALHGWGMLVRHRAERGLGIVLPRAYAALYWLCWIALGAVGVYLLIR